MGYSLEGLAFVLRESGDLEEAQSALRQALSISASEDPRNLAFRHADLASILAETDRHEEAAAQLREAIRLLDGQEVLPATVPDLRSDLGASLMAAGLYDEAEKELLAARAGLSDLVDAELEAERAEERLEELSRRRQLR